ncbi:hypothetical protein VK98_15370 [Chromobacterium sp. LK11]|uniref:hypothetical protein n=1 Tax=Chromobacterium sp. LK11 TaxID=1628212 RepID=UPI000653AE1D|nr:hypothetical protein [Chromobacterium sp. LK11]KMN81082.1 hypothetical protein VK98_15370 [Chromobacterium sp. LK11]
MATVFTLTPTSAAQALKDHGLDALGLTALRLGPSWGGANPAFDGAALTLTFAGAPKAPWRGILEYLDSLSAFRAADGAPLTGAGAALRLHPQAAARLEGLAAGRYAAPGQPQVRAVPHVMVIRGLTGNVSPHSYDPGDALPAGAAGAALSFHDARGLIVDPVAVAAMLDDLQTAFPALDISAGGASPAAAGGVRSIAGLAGGVLAQVVTLHGRAFAAAGGGPGVERQASGGGSSTALGAGGLVAISAGQQLAGTGASAAARLRLGWAGGGTMSAGPLTVPNLPAGVTLARQFVRAFAVDLDWHLRGNRGAAEINGIPADDQRIPADLQPQVRDGVRIDYLADGPDMLAAASQVAGRMMGAGAGALMFAVSPTFESGVGTAAAPGAGAHWPAFPGPNTNAGFGAGMAPPAGVTATWSGSNDVVVAIPADFAPSGATVRVFAQRFQLIQAIGEEQSFLRADGGAAIAAAGSPVSVLVRNPFGLKPGDPLPSPGTLVYDLVIVPRAGRRRMWAAQRAAIAAGPAAAPADPFAAGDPLAAWPDNIKSICQVPLFGLPRTVTPPGGSPATAADLARALLSETQPRQGPRMPTMARFDAMVVTGIPSANVSAGLDWDAVLSGGRWARESRSADHANANPGNPAGPDTHAPGVRVTGALAYDLAQHALRRAQPIFPLPGGTTPGWIAMSGGNNFNPPTAAPAAVPGTSSGVALETVCAVCETPELSLLPDGNPLGSSSPITFQNLLNQLATALGLGSAPSITVSNEDRLINAVRREFFVSKHGNRDSLWALTRAIGEADELIYIETAGFARTARPSGSPAAYEIDLAQKIADRMAANPNLKVIVCLPRETDFAPAYAPFVRRAIAQRKDAVDILQSAGAARVAVFHPRGFPGRWAQLRTTTVIVDDVWCLSGATHFRRRGMTFDGSMAVASFDRDIAGGYSRKVSAFRRQLMAAKLQVSPTDAAGLPASEWLRLQSPAAAFDLISDLLMQGGLNRLAPLWLGPTDASVIPQSDDVADPDGAAGASGLLTLAGLLSESST